MIRPYYFDLIMDLFPGKIGHDLLFAGYRAEQSLYRKDINQFTRGGCVQKHRLSRKAKDHERAPFADNCAAPNDAVKPAPVTAFSQPFAAGSVHRRRSRKSASGKA